MPFGFLQGQRSRLHRQARAGLDSAQPSPHATRRGRRGACRSRLRSHLESRCILRAPCPTSVAQWRNWCSTSEPSCA